MTEKREDEHVSLDEPMTPKEVLAWTEKVITHVTERHVEAIKELCRSQRTTFFFLWLMVMTIELMRLWG